MNQINGPATSEAQMVMADLGARLTAFDMLTGGRAARTYRVLYETEGASESRTAILRVESATGPTTGVALSPRGQFDLLRSLEGRELPVPRALAVGEVATGRYLLTTHVAGDVPSPWSRAGREILSADPLRSRLPAECASVLRRIHAIPVTDIVGLPHAWRVRPADELDRWRGILDSTPFGEDPLILWCLSRVERGLPESVPASLVHGDFRLGNLVVHDGRLAGILDWELATVGDPALDLALLLAPPVAADWHRSGLDPIDHLVGAYLESCPDGDAIESRLQAMTLLATLKVVSLWVNGARVTDGVVSASAARCALNALGSRQYLAQCLRPGHEISPAQSTRRTAWRAQVEETLRQAKETGTLEDSVLPANLTDIPDPAPGLGDELTRDALVLARALGLPTAAATDAPSTVAALVRDFVALNRGSQDASVEKRIESLVLRTVDPELAGRPW